MLDVSPSEFITVCLQFIGRFMAVVYPVSSLTLRTISNANLAILLTWLVTTITSCPIWFAHSLVNNNG